MSTTLSRKLDNKITFLIDDIAVLSNLLIVNIKSKEIYYIPDIYNFNINNFVKVNNHYFALCNNSIVVVLKPNKEVKVLKLDSQYYNNFRNCSLSEDSSYSAKKQYYICGTNSSIYRLDSELNNDTSWINPFYTQGSKAYDFINVYTVYDYDKHSNVVITESTSARFIIENGGWKHDFDKSAMKGSGIKPVDPNLSVSFPDFFFNFYMGREVVLLTVVKPFVKTAAVETINLAELKITLLDSVKSLESKLVQSNRELCEDLKKKISQKIDKI
jgi:hypothetical protein